MAEENGGNGAATGGTAITEAAAAAGAEGNKSGTGDGGTAVTKAAAAAGEGNKSGTPEEQKAAADKEAADKAEADKKAAVPEKYEFKLADGKPLDQALVDKFSPVAKELKLPQESAQKLVDLFAEIQTAQQTAQQEAWAKTQTEWRTAAETDKTMGGANFKETLANAGLFVSLFGTPELSAALDATGVGDHPEVIRAFAKAGKAAAEAGIVPGTKNTSGEPKPLEQRLFPNHK